MRAAKGLWGIMLLCAAILFLTQMAISPAMAQAGRTCYQLIKTKTCAEEPTAYGCAADTYFQMQGDGSVIFGPTKPRFPELNTKVQIWPAEGKGRLTSTTGSGELVWNVPPAVWCTDQGFTANLSMSAKGECVLEAKYGSFPTQAIEYTAGSSGNPFTYLRVDGVQNEMKSAAQDGIHPVQEIKTDDGTWLLNVQVYGNCNKDKQGDWGGDSFIQYHYKAIPAGQEPPAGNGQPGNNQPGNNQPGNNQPGNNQPGNGQPGNNQPSNNQPGNNQPGNNQPGNNQPGSGQPGNNPSSNGATNSTLSLPPYGSLEPYSGAPGLAIQAGQRRAPNGALVMLPVWLINANNNVANMNFELSYDPAVAVPEGNIIPGYMMDNVLLSTNPKQGGLILLGFASVSDLWGTGTVAYVPFRLVGAPGSRTALNLNVTTINTSSGSVPAIDRIPGEIVVLSVGEMVAGDCNGDGRLTSVDALCALQISVGLRSPILALDVDKNGGITSRDATLILQGALRR